ncbi:hypothetical protein K488DRAFT_87332 [Vararia minispora EC-137]|uniref:Uncharacterized protein n=1 Tax=Vararia minispora EC-137 TaxID=1314806 RepID=A0ACB8QGB7_9AGAM|nr:hypothetical protein K488DRAFT_87332 [Vararia minispora EC-137]
MSGPLYAATHFVYAIVNGVAAGAAGSGPTLVEAQKAASRNALRTLGNNHISLTWQTSASGPAKAETYTVHAIVNGVVTGSGGSGMSLGQAKMAAARNLHARLHKRFRWPSFRSTPVYLLNLRPTTMADYTSILHNYCQNNRISLSWQHSVSGPANTATRTVYAIVNGVVTGTSGTGSTIGQARMAASRSVLQALGIPV